MRNAALPWIALGFFLAPAMAAAEPIELRFSFFTSDRSQIYQNSVKPFVDAVNADGGPLPPAQAVINKHSGHWIDECSTERFDALDREVTETLKADARRSVVYQSPDDLKRIDAVFAAVIEQ
jgi:hypothetical protein